MPDAFEELRQQMDVFAAKKQTSAFATFEPWDVKERDPEVVEQARKDSVDLDDAEFIRHTGKAPHPFQTGYLTCNAFFRALLAGSQVGKSFAALTDAIIMLTGEIPFSMQYDAGVDTGIKRIINRANVIRFGRRCVGTNKLMDNDPTVEPDGTWDCGNVIGVGKYPTSKIGPPGSEIWIGTYMKAATEYWWPRFTEVARMIIPEYLIDKTKGVDGFNTKDRIIYLQRDTKIAIITYESGYQRYEAEKVWGIIFDEEPPDERAVAAALTHCHYFSLVETPYNGITYTKKLLFPDKMSSDKRVFHATQYDSPYQSRKQIEIVRQNMKPWEIISRVWGIHSEVRGRPYFDREKISTWLRRNMRKVELVRFNPEQPANSIEDIMLTQMRAEKQDAINKRDVWKVYEDREIGVPYVMAVDPAEGAEKADEAADVCAAIIMRPPRQKETRPQIVATLRSTLETIPFSWCCARAARYYNNALLAAETRRGAVNATFAAEMRNWRWWFKMTTLNDTTQQAKEHNGFDTNSRTREAIFELIQEWVCAHIEGEYPNIPDDELLQELAACVVGKNGRPDHTYDGTLDTTVCFGILLWVFRHAENQIRYNGEEKIEEKVPFGLIMGLLGRSAAKTAKPVSLGQGLKSLRR